MIKKSQDINYTSKDLFPKSYRKSMYDEIMEELEENKKKALELELSNKIVIINDMYKLNILNEMCSFLLNERYDNDKYDFYNLNEIKWLLNKEQEIKQDFEKDLEKHKFNILLNSKFLINEYGCELLNFKDIEEFCNYVSYIPYKCYNNKQIIKDMFDTFNNKTSKYEKMQYFLEIRRK